MTIVFLSRIAGSRRLICPFNPLPEIVNQTPKIGPSYGGTAVQTIAESFSISHLEPSLQGIIFAYLKASR